MPGTVSAPEKSANMHRADKSHLTQTIQRKARGPQLAQTLGRFPRVLKPPPSWERTSVYEASPLLILAEMAKINVGPTTSMERSWLLLNNNEHG